MESKTVIEVLKEIRKAKETLVPKPGHLPLVRELIRLHYSMVSNPIKSMEEMENFHDAKHELCGGTGKVTLVKDGYEYGGFCCTCGLGRAKKNLTIIGQNTGYYTDYLDKGYSLPNKKIPF